MNMDVIRFGLIRGIVAGLCIALWSCAQDKTDLDHLQQAKLFQEQNQWRAAMIEFKNALQKNPQNLEARQLLGMLYLDIGEAESAEKELRRVAAAGSASAKLAAPIARAMLLQRQQDKLLTEFSPPRFDDHDGTPELQGVRAEALASLGKLEPAQAAIVQAISQEPVSVAVMLSAAHVALARGKVDEARNWVQRALELSPTDPDAWLLSADLAFVATQHDAAAQDYQRALDFDQRQLLTQRNLRARVGIVFSLIAQGKQEAALPHIEVLLAANPKHFLSNYLRGLAAFKMTDFKTALD
ncbi:MAG: tetratricopeptide repeat protein, partial [Gammaproteobacteria bacterium]|nr:tetratricopeptide repeat protein [Gammaproteobacteria bacterium]